MKTICILLSLISLNSFADEYKLPFTWQAKDTEEIKVKKAEIPTNENRALASESDENEEENQDEKVRFWKFEQDKPVN